MSKRSRPARAHCRPSRRDVTALVSLADDPGRARSRRPPWSSARCTAVAATPARPLTNDFIELYNSGTTAVDVTGWSRPVRLGRRHDAGSATNLTGTIPPGRLLPRPGGGRAPAARTPLPTPDATGAIADVGHHRQGRPGHHDQTP